MKQQQPIASHVTRTRKIIIFYLLISSYFPLFPLRNLNFWFSCLKLSCIHNIILHITDQALTNTVTCYYGSRKKLMSCFLCSFWSEKGEMSHSFTIWGHWDMILETNISECNWSRYLMNITILVISKYTRQLHSGKQSSHDITA